MEFSRCARAELAYERSPVHENGPVSQNSTANVFVEVDVDLGEPEHGRIHVRNTESIYKAGSHQ
jgi:hypothetical protein